MSWSVHGSWTLPWAMVLTLGCTREPEAAADAAPTVEGAPSASGAAGSDARAASIPVAQAGDDDVRAILEALGDEGAAVMVLRPQHWAALHDALAPWSTKLPPPVRSLLEVGREPSRLSELLVRALGLPPGSPVLQGWDPGRPIVASLGEVPYDGPPGAVTPQLPVLDGWMPPARHQLWLPATDSAALTTSLGAALAQAMTEHPALVEGREGARAFRGDELTIALLPAVAAVRVVAFQGGGHPDEAALLEHLRSRLDATARPLAASPAQSLLVLPDAVLAGWLRPWRLRPLAAWWGAVEVAQAVATVSDDWHARALTKGMQIVLATELLMTDDGAELDDAAFSLWVDGGTLRLRSAMSSTAEGEALLQAATKGASETYAAAVDDAWIDAALRADARAMLEATEPPPALATLARPAELAEALAEGGGMAVVYMGLRHPFGVLRLLEQHARTERLPLPIEVLPTAVQVVWRGREGDAPRVALAVQWPEAYVDRPLAGMVPIAKREPGFESLRMDTLSPYGRPITVFGLGGESAGTFDTSKGDGFSGLLRARVSLERIGADVAVRDPERGAMLAAAGEARLTIEHRAGALVGELAWAPDGSGTPEAKVVPVVASEPGSSPKGAPVDEAARCLAAAGRRVADGLESITLVTEDQAGSIATAALAESDASLRCAAAAATTAEAAVGLRRLLVRMATDVLSSKGHDDAARELLREQCERSKDTGICERAGR